MALLSVAEAAARAGLSVPRIQQIIREGKVRAVRLGGTWLIESESVDEYVALPRKPGRPRKRKKP